jgi:hypothetical protein
LEVIIVYIFLLVVPYSLRLEILYTKFDMIRP